MRISYEEASCFFPANISQSIMASSHLTYQFGDDSYWYRISCSNGWSFKNLQFWLLLRRSGLILAVCYRSWLIDLVLRADSINKQFAISFISQVQITNLGRIWQSNFTSCQSPAHNWKLLSATTGNRNKRVPPWRHWRATQILICFVIKHPLHIENHITLWRSHNPLINFSNPSIIALVPLVLQAQISHVMTWV